MKKELEAMNNHELHDLLEDQSTNPSGNRPFASVVSARISRRTVMQGSLATAATTFLNPQVFAATSNASALDAAATEGGLVGFTPISVEQAAAADQSAPQIAEEYSIQPLAPWGTPIEPNATERYTGDPDTRPTSKQAALQVGIGHDGMWFFPMDFHEGQKFKDAGYEFSSTNGMLCINHEFGFNTHVLGKSAPESLEDVRLSQHVHGVSVIRVEKNRSGRWVLRNSRKSRRIHVNTPVCFSGPAADSEMLQNPNGNIPLGTLNNCGSGPTPWGTYLTCEENFNGYFGASDPAYVFTEAQERYGFAPNGFGYGWHLFDKRFDIADPDYANEGNRYGWIVEIDPFDGSQTPVKRTAMGRFKHEAVAIKETATGQIAAYMGDDQRFDYCYKYVSDKPWQAAIEAGESPLDEGKLYAARYDEDGVGEWLLLDTSNPVLSQLFSSQAELLVNTRLAADAVGATPMDRPEWTTIGADGEVYWTLTNNTARTEPNVANPEAPNSDGHIIRTVDDMDGLGTTFKWDIYFLASSSRETEGVFTDPDAAWADPFGRLFIGTDGSQPDGLQDQLVVFDLTADKPEAKRLLVGTDGDEVTGFTTTPDYRTAFTNLQHIGNGDPAASNYPFWRDGKTIPRDCTLVITRKDGGIVGS